ncbi:MAG: hypothetical protein WCP55_04635 [Lentisphaerota bacterium]
MESEQKATHSQSDLFYLQAEKLELWKIASEISIFFGVNLIIYDDLKDKIISIEFTGLDLKHSLDVIAWSIGVEVILRENIYYLGGNADNVEVMDSTGTSAEIAKLFGNKVNIIGDKLIIQGTEREVKRMTEAIKKMQGKETCLIRVSGYEVSEDLMRKLGIDIDKAIKYSASWESLLSNSWNPIQMGVVSVAMSVQAEQTNEDLKQILNSYVGILSGKESKIQTGESVDREIYQMSDQGTRTVSGFSNQQTGLQITIEGYKFLLDEWNFNVFIENSSFISDTKKNLFNVKNSIVLKKGETRLVGRIYKGTESVSITKGIPFLCDIPYLGWCFRVTTMKNVAKQTLFFISFVDGKGFEPAKLPQEPGLGS